MRWLRQFLFRLQPLFRKRRIEAGIADEIRLHLELATEAHIAAGLSPAEARDAAHREFGGVEQIKESYRDQRGLPWLDEFLQDVRAAYRSLRKTPRFTAVAILSLAVAISVNTTVFSLVNALLLRPLTSLRPSELATLYLSEKESGYRPFTHAEYLTLRASHETFTDVAATFPTFASVADDTGLHRGVAFFASENYFSLLGVTPQAGRFFSAEECRPNAKVPVLVVSHSFWQRLGGRDDLVGSTLRVNGQPYTVIGIAPPGFHGLNVIISTDCWAPLGVFNTFGGSAFGQGTPDLASSKPALLITARLAPSLTVESAANRLPALTRLLSQSTEGLKLEITPPSRENVGASPGRSDRDPTNMLAGCFLGISCCVLLIAGFNLGNMLLARGADRAREIAVRTALGATRARIVRQLLTEGLLLALAGGACGLLLTLWSNRVLYEAAAQLNSSVYTLALDLRPDGRVFAATLFCCLFATLAFALFPALKASRVDLVQDLKRQGGETDSRHRFGRFFAWRHVALMIQIALSLAVLFSSALFVRSALAAGRAPLGFDPSSGAVVELDFSLRGTPFGDAQRAVSAAIARARAQPGVIAAAATTLLPYGNNGAAKRIEPASPAARSRLSGENTTPHYAAVTPSYFETLGVPLLRGRDFTAGESSDPSSAYVAIIDEKLAQRLFPNSDPLGQRIREIGQSTYSAIPAEGAAPEYEIVGVCSSHQHELLGGEQLSLYVPLAAKSNHRGSVYLQVRYAATDSTQIDASLAPLRNALLAGDADLPLTLVSPFSALIDRHAPLWLTRAAAVSLSLFGAVALLLAVIGLYGIKAYAVARRTREIGIRMALGAPPRAAFTLIFRQAFLQIALALAIGSLLALAAGRLLSRFIYQISGSDPVALAAAALLLGLAALAACGLPARRASKVDPMIALRSE